MRKVIAVEGKPYPDGRIIEPGAIKCKDEFIPVVWDYDPSLLVGKASEFLRDEKTGEISMKIELSRELIHFDSDENLKNIEAGYSITVAEYHSESKPNRDLVITSGILKAVGLQYSSGNPHPKAGD
jgi:hypothetical protein